MSNDAPFTEMAARIQHNAAQEFGGAVVIVPGKDGGEPVQFVRFEQNHTVDQAIEFWSNIKARCDIAINALSRRQAEAQIVFGGRR